MGQLQVRLQVEHEQRCLSAGSAAVMFRVAQFLDWSKKVDAVCSTWRWVKTALEELAARKHFETNKPLQPYFSMWEPLAQSVGWRGLKDMLLRSQAVFLRTEFLEVLYFWVNRLLERHVMQVYDEAKLEKLESCVICALLPQEMGEYRTTWLKHLLEQSKAVVFVVRTGGKLLTLPVRGKVSASAMALHKCLQDKPEAHFLLPLVETRTSELVEPESVVLVRPPVACDMAVSTLWNVVQLTGYSALRIPMQELTYSRINKFHDSEFDFERTLRSMVFILGDGDSQVSRLCWQLGQMRSHLKPSLLPEAPDPRKAHTFLACLMLVTSRDVVQALKHKELTGMADGFAHIVAALGGKHPPCHNKRRRRKCSLPRSVRAVGLGLFWRLFQAPLQTYGVAGCPGTTGSRGFSCPCDCPPVDSGVRATYLRHTKGDGENFRVYRTTQCDKDRCVYRTTVDVDFYRNRLVLDGTFNIELDEMVTANLENCSFSVFRYRFELGTAFRVDTQLLWPILIVDLTQCNNVLEATSTTSFSPSISLAFFSKQHRNEVHRWLHGIRLSLGFHFT